VIDPLLLEFGVDAPAHHSFVVWTAKIDRWWPASHTTTGEPGSRVVLEGRPGGRIFERTPAGREVDWGEVTRWEPPHRLGYLWHIRRDRADATDVELTFVHRGVSGTLLRVDHRGWERLGADGRRWRDANAGGWGGLVPHFAAYAAGAVAAP
jgi:uncharacterized protein YndB with AHSA1/START domain